MRHRFKASPVRSNASGSIESTAPGGAATSRPMPRRHSMPRSGATSPLFRTRGSGDDWRKARGNRVDILILARRGRLALSGGMRYMLATRVGMAISEFSGFSVLPLSEPDNDFHHRRYRPRIPAVPGRGGRTAAPDGAFGLFGNRYFPARADLERL